MPPRSPSWLVLVALLAGPALGASPRVAVPRLPAAEPVWTASFDRLGIPFASPEAAAPLARALAQGGLSPAALETLAPDRRLAAFEAARSSLRSEAEAWAAPALAAAAGLHPESLDEGTLADAHAELRYLGEVLSPYLSPETAARARHLRAALRAALGHREAARQRASAAATAEALGGLTLESGLPEAGHAGLSRPSSRLAPSRPRTPEKDRARRLALFADAASSLFGGKAPALAADMDETLSPSRQPMSPAMTRAVADLLRAGGSLAVLSGSSFEAVSRQVAAPLRKELGDDDAALGRLVLAARSGSQVYRWDKSSRRFKLERIVDLESVLIAQGVERGVERVRAVLDEAARHFDFELAMRLATGRGIAGPVVVEDRIGGSRILTQLTLVPTGLDVSEADKVRYDESGGAERRRAYAAFINLRLREEGLPLEARVAGKTSIDIGIDKGFGLGAAAQELKADPARLVWAGDSHAQDGNDAPAARRAGLVVNVGPRPARDPHRRTFTEEDAGPAGLIPYLEALEAYARSDRAAPDSRP